MAALSHLAARLGPLSRSAVTASALCFRRGTDRAGNTSRKSTICAVPDRNGAPSMSQMARPPEKRKFLLRSCPSAALRGAKAVLAILHYQTRTAARPKSAPVGRR
jgi:hypothetical protein